MTPVLDLNFTTISIVPAFFTFCGALSPRIDVISMRMMASFSTGFSAADRPLT